jgi:hypothetical protein
VTPIQRAQAIGLISLKAQVSAYSSVFLLSSIVVGVGALLVLFVKFPKHHAGEERTEVMVE